MHSPEFFRDLIDRELKALDFPDHPSELYDPIRYMLSLGGKRLRPCLVLMANELFGADHRHVIKPAIAIEVFHNFTLLHDDIMDRAELRRSKPTVHTRWNQDIAILSGDTMFVKSCQLMMSVDRNYQDKVMSLFLRTAAEVCEGQQIDMNFENRSNVTIPEYIEMITLKTAVLLACSLQTGALLAGASQEDADRIYDVGKHLGVAFQLHDDILDLYAETGKFGKTIGGDIIANKKTILLLLAVEKAGDDLRDELNTLINATSMDPEKKIYAIRDIFEKLEIRKEACRYMDSHFSKAMKVFGEIKVEPLRKEPLTDLAERLMVRES
jgi:geranylgeranyl diphosphate synthase type II